MTITDWSKISRYLIDDIHHIVAWAQEKEICDHNLEMLPRGIEVKSPVFATRCAAAMSDLANNHPDQITPYIKRLITQILVFFDPRNTQPYARDRQVQAIKKANANEGRTSMRTSISMLDELADWWGEMTPVERGDWIARHRKVK